MEAFVWSSVIVAGLVYLARRDRAPQPIDMQIKRSIRPIRKFEMVQPKHKATQTKTDSPMSESSSSFEFTSEWFKTNNVQKKRSMVPPNSPRRSLQRPQSGSADRPNTAVHQHGRPPLAPRRAAKFVPLLSEQLNWLERRSCKNGLTLERLDNRLPHYRYNCVLACKSCNSKRFDRDTGILKRYFSIWKNITHTVRVQVDDRRAASFVS